MEMNGFPYGTLPMLCHKCYRTFLSQDGAHLGVAWKQDRVAPDEEASLQQVALLLF